LVLRSVAVADVVVRSPPLRARSPEVVMLPVAPAIEKLVAVTSLAPRERALTISGSERSMALVMPPAEDWILIPAGRASLVSRFSNRASWEGGVGLLPLARAK